MMYPSKALPGILSEDHRGTLYLHTTHGMRKLPASLSHALRERDYRLAARFSEQRQQLRRLLSLFRWLMAFALAFLVWKLWTLA